MHFRHYSLRIKISFKISFQCLLKLILIKKFHGTLEKVPWNFLIKISWSNTCGSMEFQGIPWNFVQIQSSMEFHGTFSILPSSIEFHGTFNFPQKSSMEFHGIPWNFFEVPWNTMEFHGTWSISYFKNNISKYCVSYLIDDKMLFG